MIFFLIVLISVCLAQGMQYSQEELKKKELSHTIFILATARGLKEDVTQFLPWLHACDVLTALFYEKPLLRKKFYKNIVFTQMYDINRLNLAAEIMIVKIPHTSEEFRQLPLKKIKSNTLKKFIIAGFLSQIHAIKTKNGQIGSEVAGRILQYVPANELIYKLKNEDLVQKKSKKQTNQSKQLIVWRNVY